MQKHKTTFIFASLLLLSIAAPTLAQREIERSRTITRTTIRDTYDDAARLATPGTTLRRARTLFIAPSQRIDASYVEYKLLKTPQLANWQIQIVKDARQADLILTLDQVRLNYLFTITDPNTSAVIVSGKVVAINDPVAADFLGYEILKRMREVRGLD